MPKNSSVASIRTLWENNPDTPLSSANLSRLQDLTASYLNTDGYPDLFPSSHVEGSILFPHPDDSTSIIIKRGTVIQIINEAVDNSGNPVIPKNSQYRVFDVGLEDIILSYGDTDDTQADKSSWGSAATKWYVYLCDKDDGSVVKEEIDDYGGGAQILISKRSDYPVGQVPGRTQHNYSEKDTRLIGGFRTSGGIIDSDTVWDVAGKFQKVKAKAYYILDEYAAGGFEYRKIRLQDIDTDTVNTFLSDVIVNGTLSASSITLATDMSSQTATINDLDVDTIDVNGAAILNSTLDISGETTIGSDLSINGNFQVLNGANNVFSIDSSTQSIVVDANYSIDGTLELSGDFNQTGNTTFGGTGSTITLNGEVLVTGTSTFNEDVVIDGNLSISSVDDSTTVFSVNNDTQVVAVDSSQFNINTGVFAVTAPTTFTGGFSINSPGENILITTTRNVLSTVGDGYNWKHSGDFIVDGGDSVFTVRSASDNEIFSINNLTEQITVDGVVDVIVADGGTFSVKNHLGQPILGAEYNNSLPAENRVYIDNSLVISQDSAENALNVTGNGLFTGNLTVEGLLYADIQGEVTGGASSWTSPITITVNGDATGSVSFDGSSDQTLTLQIVDDSHNHDTRYYTETELQTSGSALVHWGNISNKPATYNPSAHTHDEYLESGDINFSFLEGKNLVLTPGSENGDSEVLARSNHKHDDLYMPIGAGNYSAIDIAFDNSIEGILNSTEVQGAIDEITTNYVKSDTSVSFLDVSADSFSSISHVLSSDGAFVSSVGTVSGVTGERLGLLFAVDETDFRQVYVDTNNILKFYNSSNASTKRIVLSNSSTSDAAASADRLSTARSITLSGDVSGSVLFDGSSNVGITTTVANDSHTHDDRYYTETELNNGQLDNRYYTETEVDGFLTNKSNVGHAHSEYQPKEDGFVYGRVFVNNAPADPQDGDLYINQTTGDVKLCLDGANNFWVLMTHNSTSPPT